MSEILGVGLVAAGAWLCVFITVPSAVVIATARKGAEQQKEGTGAAIAGCVWGGLIVLGLFMMWAGVKVL